MTALIPVGVVPPGMSTVNDHLPNGMVYDPDGFILAEPHLEEFGLHVDWKGLARSLTEKGEGK